MQGHAQSPQRGAFNLGLGAVRMNDRAGVNDKAQFFDLDAAAGAVEPYAGDAGDPSRHVAFLAEAGGDAEADVLRHCAAPVGFLSNAREHGRLPLGTADRVWRGSGIAPGAVQKPQPKRHGIDAGGVSGLVHEAFDRPVGPSRSDRAQPARPKGSVGEIIAQRANPMRSHRVPMVGAADGERIKWAAVGVFGHERRRHDRRGPSRGGVMSHRRHFAAIFECHAHDLDRG